MHHSDNNDLGIPVHELSRRDERSLIFHLLYAAESLDYQEPLDTIVYNFNLGFELNIDLDGYVVKAAREIIETRDQLDQAFIPFLDNWKLERVSVVVKLLLRLAVWEMLNTDTESTIIINEAIELTKDFAEEGAHRFVNGILDRIAKNKAAIKP